MAVQRLCTAIRKEVVVVNFTGKVSSNTANAPAEIWTAYLQRQVQPAQNLDTFRLGKR
jgi:hypothetical protein